jgi:hypothetical protein
VPPDGVDVIYPCAELELGTHYLAFKSLIFDVYSCSECFCHMSG